MTVAREWGVDVSFDAGAALQISRMAWGNVNNDALRGTRGSGDNEWFTPVEHIEAGREVLGGIDLDPASHQAAQEAVRAEEYFTREDNGLEQEWHGRVWLNPPYGREEIGLFVNKLINEIGCGRTTAAIMLTHNYSDTEWFHTAVSAADALCFTLGRVKFIDSGGEPANPTQGQTFFYYGPDVGLFHQAFQAFGFIAVPWGSQASRRAVTEVARGLPGSDPAAELEGLPHSAGDG
jgi:phage N-6-adenine-methyltransferase